MFLFILHYVHQLGQWIANVATAHAARFAPGTVSTGNPAFVILLRATSMSSTSIEGLVPVCLSHSGGEADLHSHLLAPVSARSARRHPRRTRRRLQVAAAC